MKCGFFESDITPAFGSIIPGDIITDAAIALYDQM